MIVPLLLFLAAPSRAAFTVPGYELVYSYPVETSLEEPDLRQASAVWPEMIDASTRAVDVEHFYITPSMDPPLDPALEPTLQALERAGKRGVRIRVLLERKFAKNSVAGIDRLVRIPTLELRFIDWGLVGRTGKGIVHAKFFVIDSSAAFVGSHNLDWRALDQIHELGLAVSEPSVVRQAQAVFDHDWAVAGATDWDVKPRAEKPAADVSKKSYLVASPWRYNPDGVGDSESELVRLIGTAKKELVAQTYDYLPQGFGKDAPAYTVVDDALREALKRGVRVKLIVDRLNEDAKHLAHLRRLSEAGAEVRVVEIPDAKRGHIDYARVIHSKYMVVDGKTLWLGTSNWAGGYLDDSRNLELVVRDEALAKRVAVIHAKLWLSPYALTLEKLGGSP